MSTVSIVVVLIWYLMLILNAGFLSFSVECMRRGKDGRCNGGIIIWKQLGGTACKRWSAPVSRLALGGPLDCQQLSTLDPSGLTPPSMLRC